MNRLACGVGCRAYYNNNICVVVYKAYIIIIIGVEDMCCVYCTNLRSEYVLGRYIRTMFNSDELNVHYRDAPPLGGRRDV